MTIPLRPGYYLRRAPSRTSDVAPLGRGGAGVPPWGTAHPTKDSLGSLPSGPTPASPAGEFSTQPARETLRAPACVTLDAPQRAARGDGPVCANLRNLRLKNRAPLFAAAGADPARLAGSLAGCAPRRLAGPPPRASLASVRRRRLWERANERAFPVLACSLSVACSGVPR